MNLAPSSPSTRIDAVVVLAGGEGRRLGGPKAWLGWGGRPLLLHLVERLAALSRAPPVVVGTPGMELPPGSYARVDDARIGEGPLAGLAAGLGAVEAIDVGARVAVCACDCPFVGPELFRFLAGVDPQAKVVVPKFGDHLHPLIAIWRAGTAAACRRALERGERRVLAALEELAPRVVPAEEFPAGFDLARTLFNLNDRRDLLRARSWRS
ncbi:MAG: molybdenum cofactor guanylyltransferase [Gemmatimonadota bacterium]